MLVKEIVTDDDVTMRANLNNKRNKEKLEDGIPETEFLADPGHRVKVMVKSIFTKATKMKDPQKRKI